MKFALVTADKNHGIQFRIKGEEGDSTSFLSWVSIWGGYHFSFKKMGEDEDISYLKDFDVVMFSGHLNHIADIIRIADYLKDSSVVTIFYPEGSTQLYDNSINGFQPLYYEAWNVCDILSSAEEDKISYYESFIHSKTIVRFIHVPITEEMRTAKFFLPRTMKNRSMIAVYGDNNPNHPLIALTCANRLGLDVLGIDLRGKEFQRVFPESKIRIFERDKLAQNYFLKILGATIVHIYPTEWIGTARQQISCACVGTPCIGNRESHTQRRLFPSLGVNIYDIERICELANRLIEDADFYNGIVKSAWDNLGFYSMESTKKRFMLAVEDARRVKNLSEQVSV